MVMQRAYPSVFYFCEVPFSTGMMALIPFSHPSNEVVRNLYHVLLPLLFTTELVELHFSNSCVVDFSNALKKIYAERCFDNQ